MRKRKAMTSEAASLKKIGGHLVEHDFAEIIGGEVNRGDQQAKKDVIDQSHRSHSVKSGTKWQIFLYGRKRLSTNTILQTIGDVAEILVDCIDSFPETFAQHQEDKSIGKTALQIPMRRLCAELQNNQTRAAFFDKSLFNGGEVDYLTIRDDDELFHIFENQMVVSVLSSFDVENSRKRQEGQFDAQKVVFKRGASIGEIEMRNDSAQHYKEVKFWLHGKKFLSILQETLEQNFEHRDKIVVYGKAINSFKQII